MDSLGLAMVLVIPVAIALIIIFGWGTTVLLLLFKRTRALALSVSLTGVVSAGYCLIYSMFTSFIVPGARTTAARLPFQQMASSGFALAFGFAIGASCAALIGFPIFLLYTTVLKKRQKEP